MVCKLNVKMILSSKVVSFCIRSTSPAATDRPFFIGSVWGTRAWTWFSDDLRVSLPEGKSVLLCSAVC